MKKTLLTIITILVSSWASSAMALPGVVVEKSGSLLILYPDGKRVVVTAGTEFYDGCKLIGANGKALLLLSNGALVSIAGSQTFDTKQLPTTSVPKNVGGLAIGLEDSFSVKKMGPVGMSVAPDLRPPAGGIRGVAPVYGALALPDGIHFQWKGKSILSSDPVLVFINPTKSEPLLFPVKKDQKELSVKSSELCLEPGAEYSWYLGHLKKGKPIGQSRVFTFRILSESEKQNLDKDLNGLKTLPATSMEGRDFLKAQIFYKFKMYQDMVETLKPLYKKYHTSGIGRFLYLGYIRLGRHDEAEKYEGRG
ncbi:MAG: hypothetical protein Q7T03_08720 [Deltaproteobacteria bacterium]|nr:hypothetical protein [Deltaproteobacteria bacterium]